MARSPADSRFVSEEARLLHALAQSTPAILWMTDPEGRCTFLSRRWLELTAQPLAAALGEGWAEMVHADDRLHAQEVLRAASLSREAFSVDYRLRAGDGHRWVVAAGQPHFAEGGEFLGFVGAVFDIDDRKRMEVALRRTQQAARFLANAGVALSDMSDARSVLRQVGSLAVPFFADWCAVDLTTEGGGLERLVVVHSEPRKAPLATEISRRWLPDPSDATGPGKVVRTGEPELVEELPDPGLVSWARDDGHREVLRALGVASYICVAVRWRQETRATLTFVATQAERRYGPDDLRVAEDLAHRASLAIQNAELYRMAVDADRRKDEFLAVLSHELRTPLNAIVGWSHVLRDALLNPQKPLPAETIQKAVDTIHRNAQIQNQLIADILDISRIVAGKLRLDVRPLELPAVIEAALDTLRPAAAAKQVRVESVLDPGAGPISGDASRLQQILWNLLSNALRFVPSKVGRVQVRLEAVNSHVRLTVEDNGPGIDPAFLPHIFDRFRQADSSTSRAHQGLGLGLAIVRNLVELHGGTVQAGNREGGGAVFTVELPRRSVAAVARTGPSDRQPRVEEPLWLEAAPTLQGRRLLVVDDQADAREMLKEVLERCGATVVLATTASEALGLVRAERPEVVVTDIEMPGESGYDLLRDLRALPADAGGHTPAVALTAYATAHDRVRVLRAGFQMHVAKPVQPAELVTVVASLIRPR
jgi:PAS domain S-box-containing protein